MLRLADDNGVLEPNLMRLTNLIEGIKGGPFNRPGNFMRSELKRHLAESVATLNSAG